MRDESRLRCGAVFAAADELMELVDVMDIPLLGAVAAGRPYRAFPVADTLAVPTTLWGGKQVFALRVRGDSMIDEGIHDGDFLIVEPRPTADNGQTVVAEVDGCVTVKKYFREADGSVRLQPANPEMLPLIIRGEEVRIVGVVSGVLRKFGFQGAKQGSAPRPPAPVPRRSRRAAAGVAARGPLPALTKRDDAVLELGINVIDSQLVRWNAAIERARKERRLRQYVVKMAELGRDLQALRDWCARTTRPGLRRALLGEASQVMRRMQKFASVTPVELPDLVLH
ncbi:hypothetical protein L6Q96_03945 [Candidatus Binatia bacterium]|nr:hypothetical protein [Candidatus Binatia bacterium]